jgi:hypothetical protein
LSLKHIVALGLVAVVLVVLGFVVYPAERVAPMILVSAAAAVGLALAPNRLGLLSWSAGIPAYYAAFFVVLPFVSRLFYSDVELDEQIANALYVAAWGLVAFTLGTLTARFANGPQRSYTGFGLLTMDLSKRPGLIATLIALGAAAKLWGFFFGYIGNQYRAGDEAGWAAGIMSWWAQLLTLAQVFAWNAYFRAKRLLFWAFVSTALLVMFGVFSNSKEAMLMPFALVGLSYWGISGRFPLKGVIVTILLYVFVATPFVTGSRLILQASQSGTRVDLFEITADYLLSEKWVQDEVPSFVASDSLGRLMLLPYFSEIVAQTGREVPFMYGRTFVHGIEALVPRFVNPDKPDTTIGNWTGQEFGSVPFDDPITNVSPTYMGEFYMNFGVAGIFFGMFVIGLIAVWVDRYLVVERWTWSMPLVVYAVRWQESLLGHTLLPVMRDAVLTLLALFVIKFFSQHRVGLFASSYRGHDGSIAIAPPARPTPHCD